MLHLDRIDVSEGIDVNKTSTSKECDICHYWFFLKSKNLKGYIKIEKNNYKIWGYFESKNKNFTNIKTYFNKKY